MPSIKKADSAGFCFGVNRAITIVNDLIDEGKKVCTLGPIIHNMEVVNELKQRGCRPIESIDELSDGETLVIRSHGVSKEIYDLLEAKGIAYVDATCPFVKRIHKIVEKESSEGKQIVIIGDPKHPEVEGIRSYAKDGANVVETAEEADSLALKKDVPICIVSQTTFNLVKFQELVAI